MPSLNKKQLRDAAPLEALPYELEARYGILTFHASLTAVKTKLNSLLDDVTAQAKRIGTPADLGRCELLRTTIAGMMPMMGKPVELDVLVDEYTGTRFQATVRDRRQG